jgi:gliding motility-associated protein GldM
MAGGKETPRQRMIGILYLVLLGLIALNVPESLLDAFKNIKDSLDQSRTNVSTSLQTTYAAFEAKKKDQPEKAAALEAQARKASAVTGDLDKYITNLRTYLVAQGGGVNPTINDVSGRDNLDIAPHVMIDGKRADTLREKVENTRKQLLAILGPKLSKDVNFSLSATDPTPRAGETRKNWQEAYFGEGIPLGAVLTTLAKVQADNKNAENEVVKKILGQIDVAQVTLNSFQAVSVPNSNYVLAGQPYTAQIYLSAYDKNSNPTIVVDGQPVHATNGVGTYTTTASGEGMHTWTGTLSVKQVDGPPKSYPISGQYMVAKPSAVVSPDKMNVFYIGVPNPVSVSAPGVSKDKINVSMTGGSISGSGGHYTVNVRSAGMAKVTVTGEKGMVLGATEFRVKRIPDPKPQFAGKSGGNTSAANIKAQDKVFAKLDNFDFDAKFNVTRFTLLVIKPRQDPLIMSAQGSELNSQMKAAINSIGPGATIVFKDIVAVGPDGTQRGLDPIVLSAN